jgi:uncharacterized protein
MAIRTAEFIIDGMTCASCERRIERALSAVPGILRAEADLGRGAVVLDYDDRLASPDSAKAAIEDAGYSARVERGAGTPIALGVGLVLAAAYLIAGSAGVFDALPKIDATIGYGMLFFVGLLTSLHCVAMCGGIALSQSLKAPRAGVVVGRMAPGLLYNGGRIISYTVLGGIVGALGSAFSFSPGVKGAIAGVAGIFMLYLGLKMLGLVPALPKPTRILPARIGERLERARLSAAGRGPLAVGLLNGLMPCGPLQTMQLYALGTGSFLAGALSMLAFSIGTLPLMLSFSLAATLLPRRLLPVMVKASAVLVMFLGVVTSARAASLAGIPLPSFAPTGVATTAYAGAPPASGAVLAASSPAAAGGAIAAALEDGIQTVTTEFKDGYYVPFSVQAGIPVKWTIRVTEDELNGCNNPVTIPAYGISKTLKAGDNLVEFTPDKTGAIVYTCWMGMISSRISVVADISRSSAADISRSSAADATASLSPGAACACCAR